MYIFIEGSKTLIVAYILRIARNLPPLNTGYLKKLFAVEISSGWKQTKQKKKNGKFRMLWPNICLFILFFFFFQPSSTFCCSYFPDRSDEALKAWINYSRRLCAPLLKFTRSASKELFLNVSPVDTHARARTLRLLHFSNMIVHARRIQLTVLFLNVRTMRDSSFGSSEISWRDREKRRRVGRGGMVAWPVAFNLARPTVVKQYSH